MSRITDGLNAEVFVNLTQIKQRMSLETETFGHALWLALSPGALHGTYSFARSTLIVVMFVPGSSSST